MLEKQVSEMLGKLAEKLGVASAKIWEWSMLQVQVDIYTTISQFILAIILTYIFYKVCIKTYKNYQALYDKDLEFPTMLGLFIVGILLIIFDSVVLFTLMDLPQLIVNPEYSAFQNILNQLSTLK